MNALETIGRIQAARVVLESVQVGGLDTILGRLHDMSRWYLQRIEEEIIRSIPAPPSDPNELAARAALERIVLPLSEALAVGKSIHVRPRAEPLPGYAVIIQARPELEASK